MTEKDRNTAADTPAAKNTNNHEKNSFARECIIMALSRLLEKKNIDDITVTELARVAGVSRTTFYRNYHSITDVLDDYFSHNPFGAPSVEYYAPEKFALEKRLRESFQSIRDKKDLVYGLIRSGQDLLIYKAYDKYIKTTCKGRAFDIGFRSEYELSAFSGIYFSICYNWIHGGMKESIDEMVDISYQILHTFYKKDENAVPERDDVYQPKHIPL